MIAGREDGGMTCGEGGSSKDSKIMSTLSVWLREKETSIRQDPTCEKILYMGTESKLVSTSAVKTRLSKDKGDSQRVQ